MPVLQHGISTCKPPAIQGLWTEPCFLRIVNSGIPRGWRCLSVVQCTAAWQSMPLDILLIAGDEHQHSCSHPWRSGSCIFRHHMTGAPFYHGLVSTEYSEYMENVLCSQMKGSIHHIKGPAIHSIQTTVDHPAILDPLGNCSNIRLGPLWIHESQKRKSDNVSACYIVLLHSPCQLPKRSSALSLLCVPDPAVISRRAFQRGVWIWCDGVFI